MQYALHVNVDRSNVPDSPSTKGRLAAGRFGYAAGPLDVALAYAESTAADGIVVNAAGAPTGVALDEKIKTLSLGASYNFNAFKLFGELTQLRDDSRSIQSSVFATRENDKYNGGVIGVTVPVGAGLIKASYARMNFDNDPGSSAPLAPHLNSSTQKFAVGYEYNFSKRTAVYATAAYIRVKGGQNNPPIMGSTTGGTAGYLSTGNGVSGYAPGSSTGYDFGIRHTF
jgi:predicted porin